jgi:signal transduction histidine kinase
VDVGLALLAYLATVNPLIDSDHSGVLLLASALATLPLIWRRRAPLGVAMVTGAGTLTLASITYLHSVPLGQLAATYTFAALSPPRRRLPASAAPAAGVAVTLLRMGSSPAAIAYTAMSFVTVYSLGAGARERRARIELLESRSRGERAAAAAAERARIARDMHDVLAHSVGLMVVQAEGGAAMVRLDAARAETAFDAVADIGREALVQLRHTLGVLREGAGDADSDPGEGPEGMDTVVAARVPELVERSRRTGLDVRYVERGTAVPLPAAVDETVYRLVQEALTNVVKHAGARRVDVTLAWHGEELTVRVVDDGRGTAAHTGHPGVDAAPRGDAQPAGGGHGLAGMAARVSRCGGRFAVGPGTGRQGFQVMATLPANLPADADADAGAARP